MTAPQVRAVRRRLQRRLLVDLNLRYLNSYTLLVRFGYSDGSQRERVLTGQRCDGIVNAAHRRWSEQAAGFSFVVGADAP